MIRKIARQNNKDIPGDYFQKLEADNAKMAKVFAPRHVKFLRRSHFMFTFPLFFEIVFLS